MVDGAGDGGALRQREHEGIKVVNHRRCTDCCNCPQVSASASPLAMQGRVAEFDPCPCRVVTVLTMTL